MFEPVAEAAVDRALAGPLPEAIARSLVEHHVIERVVREVLASADFDAAVSAALDGRRGERLVERVLASPRTERLLGEALESKLTAQLADRMLQEPGVRATCSPRRCRARRCATAIAAADDDDRRRDDRRRSARLRPSTSTRGSSGGPRRLVRRKPREAAVATGRPSAPYGGFATRGVGARRSTRCSPSSIYLIGAAMVALARLARRRDPSASGSQTRSPAWAGPRCRSPTSPASGPLPVGRPGCTSLGAAPPRPGRPAAGRAPLTRASRRPLARDRDRLPRLPSRPRRRPPPSAPGLPGGHRGAVLRARPREGRDPRPAGAVNDLVEPGAYASVRSPGRNERTNRCEGRPGRPSLRTLPRPAGRLT